MFALYEGGSGNPAVFEDVEAYADRIGNPNFPIFADGNELIKEATPMTQTTHPEMCGLTPDLEIISCYAGHNGFYFALDDIKAHAEIE